MKIYFVEVNDLAKPARLIFAKEIVSILELWKSIHTTYGISVQTFAVSINNLSHKSHDNTRVSLTLILLLI